MIVQALKSVNGLGGVFSRSEEGSSVASKGSQEEGSHIGFEKPGTRSVPEPQQSLFFDLPHALSGDAQ